VHQTTHLQPLISTFMMRRRASEQGKKTVEREMAEILPMRKRSEEYNLKKLQSVKS